MKTTANQYAKTLYELTLEKSQSEIGEMVSEFAKLLAKKNQAKLLPKIIEKFNEIWNKNNGIVKAEITSARKLEDSEVHKIENHIKNKYKAKKILINNIINESLKGGMIIQVGDEVMDGSIKRQLGDLRKILEK